MTRHFLTAFALASLLSACVIPTGAPSRPWGTVEVDGTTYEIEAQQHQQHDGVFDGPSGLAPFDLYFVTVGDRRAECGIRAGASEAEIRAACRSRILALLAAEERGDDDDDDDGYSVPDY